MAAVGALLGLAFSLSAQALVINPTYTGLSPAVQAEIASAIDFYETTFSDPITVDIEFHEMKTGLGRSDLHWYFWSYQAYRAALIADATSPDDATANATLGPPPNDPILNELYISLKPANGRAVGLPTPGLSIDLPGTCNFVGDGCIGLNIGETTLGGGRYSLFAVIQHEIDEILGLGSSLQPDGTIWQGYVSPEDLFRYTSPGVRSFGVNNCSADTPSAFLSIDGGTTNLNQFNNCANDGDYGDWVTSTPPQVQDAFATPGTSPFLTTTDPAVVGLDVIGYTLKAPAQIPEPASLLLLATALVGMRATRRGNARRSGVARRPVARRRGALAAPSRPSSPPP